MGRRARTDRFGDMLFDSVLQPLGPSQRIDMGTALNSSLGQPLGPFQRIDLGTALILSSSLWDLPKGCSTESNNMSPNLCVLALLPKNAYSLLVGANLPPRLIPSLLFLIQPLDFIFYKILSALNITMTADFLFLPKAAHLFIYLLLKPLSSKLLTPSSADKKNSYTDRLKIVH